MSLRRESFRSAVETAFAPVVAMGFVPGAVEFGRGALMEFESDWMDLRVVRDRGEHLLSMRFPGQDWWPAEFVFEASGLQWDPTEATSFGEMAARIVRGHDELRSFFKKGAEARRASEVESKRRAYLEKRFGRSETS